MPRKSAIAKREVLPNPLYNSKLVTRTINRLMLDGKRGKLLLSYMLLLISCANKPVKTQ